MITNNSRIKINSLLAASVIAETNICAISSAFMTIPMVSVLLMGCILIAGFSLNKNALRISQTSIVAFGLFFLLLLLSIVLNGLKVPGERFLYLMTFGLSAMVIVNTRHDFRLVLKYLLYIYTAHLIVYFLLQREAFLTSDDFWTAQLGIAYGFVPATIISVILLFYRKRLVAEGVLVKRRFFQIGLYVALFLTSGYVFLIDCATRGAIVVVVVGLFFIIYRNLSRKQKVLFTIAGAAFSIFLLLNLDSIISNSLDRFSEGNVKSLVKLSQMTEAGDASNGREDHYKEAYEMIADNPVLGYGVGYFENVTRASYVHQLFLELMLECGLFGTLLFLVPILKFIRRAWEEHDDIDYSYKILLLSCCFLPLMFSASFWLYPPFWYGYFYAINSGNIQRKQIALSV